MPPTVPQAIAGSDLYAAPQSINQNGRAANPAHTTRLPASLQHMELVEVTSILQ